MNLKELSIHTLETLSADDMKKIVDCIEDSFSKKLNPAFLSKTFEKVFFFNDWKGVGIVKNLNGFFYLDKLAIRQKFRGSGLGNLLLSFIIEHSKSLIWRSSRENIFQEFYFKFCDGFIRTPNWNIFWVHYSLDSNLIQMIQQLSQTPADFDELK